jgi:hypothetical protein
MNKGKIKLLILWNKTCLYTYLYQIIWCETKMEESSHAKQESLLFCQYFVFYWFIWYEINNNFDLAKTIYLKHRDKQNITITKTYTYNLNNSKRWLLKSL